MILFIIRAFCRITGDRAGHYTAFSVGAADIFL